MSRRHAPWLLDVVTLVCGVGVGVAGIAGGSWVYEHVSHRAGVGVVVGTALVLWAWVYVLEGGGSRRG